jgi:hypothetical protein
MEVSFGFGRDMPLLYRNAEALGPVLIHSPEIENRVSGRIETAYASAKELIRTHEPSIRHLARELLKHPVLDGRELESVLDFLTERQGIRAAARQNGDPGQTSFGPPSSPR